MVVFVGFNVTEFGVVKGDEEMLAVEDVKVACAIIGVEDGDLK